MTFGHLAACCVAKVASALEVSVEQTPHGHGIDRTPIVDLKPLFRAALRPIVRLDAYLYDVSPDGQRFPLNTLVEQRTRESLALVVNWLGRLARP